MARKIYLATSWRNEFHESTKVLLRSWGHEVYDFKEDTFRLKGLPETPKEDREALERVQLAIGGGVPPATAFAWSDLDSDYLDWAPENYRWHLLSKQRASQGFVSDLRGMEWADTCVMLLPCGNSAHIEAGYMKGRGKRAICHWPNNQPTKFDPDLMYLLFDNITIGEQELMSALE